MYGIVMIWALPIMLVVKSVIGCVFGSSDEMERILDRPVVVVR